MAATLSGTTSRLRRDGVGSLIYPIIIAFFSYSFFVPVYTKFLIPEGHPPLHFWQLVLLRLALTTAAYFLMALAYSLVSLAFQIPLSNGHPHGDTEMAMNLDAFMKRTFVVYWMLNWVGMYALGLASENVTMIIGQPWTALYVIAISVPLSFCFLRCPHSLTAVRTGGSPSG